MGQKEKSEMTINSETENEISISERMKNANCLESKRLKVLDEFMEQVEKNKPKNEVCNNDIPNYNGMELLSNGLEDIPKLINPIFHRVGLGALIGSSDTGKSSLLRHLCVCVVSGKDFLGWEVEAKHKTAYYVSTEDDMLSISSLLKKQNCDYELKPQELENLIYIFDTENLLERLESCLQEKPADLIVIDALSDLFSGALYETNQVRAFLNQYNQLAQKHGCLIIFLHHTNKRSDDQLPSKHNSLGSQGIEAKMRLMLELKADSLNPSLKHLCVVKGNYLSSEFKTHSYDILFTDNMTFSNTNKKTHFELINKNKDNIESLEYEVNEIIALKEKGLTYEEIGKRLGVSPSSISRKMKKYKEYVALNESSNR